MNTKNMVVSNLEPVDGIDGHRKSFYGKARVVEIGGEFVLVSYATPMCGVVGENVVRYSEFSSRTTDRHVRAFLARFAPGVRYAEFMSMAASPIPDFGEEFAEAFDWE